MNRHSKLKPRVMERHNDGCGRLGADAGKTARDWTLIQVYRSVFDDGNKKHVYSILKHVGCQEFCSAGETCWEGLDSHIDLWLEYCGQWLGFSPELEVEGL